ncbi:MAG: hypothetical protein WBX00_05460 [Isosphaeraceae bacterium]
MRGKTIDTRPATPRGGPAPGRAAAPLLSITLVIMAAGVVIPYSRLGAAIGMTPLHAVPWLVAVLTGYCALTQVVKQWLVRKYGSWL